MRIRFLLPVAIVLMTALALAQSSQQPITEPLSTPQKSAQQPMTMEQRSSQEPIIKTAEQSAFKTSAGLPDCYTSMIERGDPKTGPYVAYVKVHNGCTLPWHWHTFSEQVMFVGGSGQLQMKGQQAQSVGEGTYYYIPAHHQHQFACTKDCTFYFSRDGAADIHYVDAAGKEISPEAALAAVGERPATAVAARH